MSTPSISSSSSSSSSSDGKAPSAEETKAAILALVKANPNSATLLASIGPKLLAGMIVRHTTKTTLDRDDDNYDSDADDFDEHHAGSLPQPTATEAIAALVKGGKAEDVTLWRGASPEMAKAIVANQSAGGAPADTGTAAVDEATRKKQIAFGATAPEFTSDPQVIGFSRDNWLVVVRINTKFLAKGSGSESGWIARHEAPVEVLAVVDRTRNKIPKKKANAS